MVKRSHRQLKELQRKSLRCPLVLPGQLPGVPEPPLAVFQESHRATPSHIPARVTSTLQEPPKIPPVIQDASFVYVRRGDAKPPLTTALRCHLTLLKFFILDFGERRKSVSVGRLKPHAGPLIFTPAVDVATLICRWLLQRRHLGGRGVVLTLVY